ncbi:maternal embryonic leucine zipper kinase-like [Phymastichus coffea]|uniref:maternal embryonic leucine zipper kinase-like n=1 Tax=Phymastichus coffea TaxID=108790 RepID=UPI00273AE7E8|nr:maternal embryonic leucine zipper kinase-like [Phymastichus coffea]
MAKILTDKAVYEKSNMVQYTVLKDYYNLEKTIGCGGFAKVKLATHIATGEKVAIKIMEKATLGQDLPRAKLEINAMKHLLHQNICKLYQVMETEDYYFIVMEYCSGGELFDHIVEKSRLTESEARKFFRQIISAVAYLHSLGYAHRDIKPENVLLDENQNLKLIDFGLCAKPNGGMQSHLYTSCGSPTYAAPELIMGDKYLGSEIDIWSLGVLLYALLCGFLPFDDSRIEYLYKKILDGEYDEPEWLSRSSKRLIRAMLQTDPKKRINIKDLCSHPWITAGFLNPVSITKLSGFEKDEDVLDTLTNIFGGDSDEYWNKIKEDNRTDYKTATYLLLLDKRKQNPAILAKFQSDYYKMKRIAENNVNRSDSVPCESSMKGRKRRRSNDHNEITPPAPTKRFANTCRRSVTPIRKSTNCGSSTPSTPGSARKLLTNLERNFNKVKCILTPKRSRNLECENVNKPNIFTGKNLCNLSSTSSTSPQDILLQLQNALQKKGILCKQKGFILYGETDTSKRRCKSNVINGSKSLPSKSFCSFELEVCLIKNTAEKPIVGIRRKRLQGDAWMYKQVCEEILALAAKQLPDERINV